MKVIRAGGMLSKDDFVSLRQHGCGDIWLSVQECGTRDAIASTNLTLKQAIQLQRELTRLIRERKVVG